MNFDICPHCSKPLSYPEYAWNNVCTYKKPATVRTDCCGKAVRLIPRFTVETCAAFNVGESDDWGNEYDTE